MGASVPSMSSRIAALSAEARRGASASGRSADVTALVCPLMPGLRTPKFGRRERSNWPSTAPRRDCSVPVRRGRRDGDRRSGTRGLGSRAMSQPTQGDGYAVSALDQMGEGYGFRKIRREVGVTAFGINAIVLPRGYQTGMHYHEE